MLDTEPKRIMESDAWYFFAFLKEVED